MVFDSETHPFQPFLPEGMRVLMLGTFPPSAKRWTMEFYYPNWINDMWRIMGLNFFGNKDYFCDNQQKRYHIDLIKQFLTDNKIGMYDTGTKVSRLKGNASDKYLQIDSAIDLDSYVKRFPTIEAVMTTGEKAASVIATITDSTVPTKGGCEQIQVVGKTLFHYRMPSSSRAYPMPLSDKAAMYADAFTALGYTLFRKL